jgi:hypothetical protein
MADPFHGNRAKKQEAVHMAYQKALSIPKPQAPHPLEIGTHTFDSKKTYLHPVHRYQMNEWEYKVYIQEEKDKEEERAAGMATLEKSMAGAGGVRENQQYTLALKTAFELGMNAGLMQRAPPPPCSACERRKERNRLAAQTSRVEKRRLELMQPPRRDVVGRIVRSTSGPAPPAPSFSYPSATVSTSASTASKVDNKEHDQEEDKEDEDEDEEEADETEDETHLQPPPF